MKRLLSLFLACLMVFSLAACGEKDPAVSDTPTSESPAAEVDFLPDNEEDLAEKLLGFSGSEELLNLDGQSVSGEIYLYWLGNMTAYYSYMYSMYGMTLDLDAEMSDGTTYGETMKELAYQNCLLLAVTPVLAKELGVELDAEDLAGLVEERASAMEAAGGEEEYAKNLQAMGLSDRNSFELDKITALYDKMKEQYVAETLGTLTNEEMESYAEENDLLSAKHILILTQDQTTGETYDEEKKAEAKAKAEDILAQLKAGGDFDTLMQENSEDTGLESYPDGYVFTAGEMVTEFEDATRGLEIGGMTEELVESSYGYHIILRQSPINDETRQEAAEDKFNDLIQERMDQAKVVKSENYDSFTAGEYYSKLLEYQQTLLAEDADDTTPESAEPSQEAGTETEDPAESEQPEG